jgi:hypothetical protein
MQRGIMNPSRRQLLALAAAAGAAALGGLPGWAAEEPGLPPPGEIEAIVERGLYFLQRLARPDGSYESSLPRGLSAALCSLAFMAAGHTMDLGRFGPTVRNGLGYLLAQADEAGYFGGDGSRLEGHALATITLAQAAGTELEETFRARVRLALEKATVVLAAAQDTMRTDGRHAGGWGAEPVSATSDLVSTAWCLGALVAADDAGIALVPPRRARAAEFVLRCQGQGPAGQVAEPRAFAPTPGGPADVAATAAGVLCLHWLDRDAEAVAAAAYLVDNPWREGLRLPLLLLGHAALVTQGPSPGGREAVASAVGRAIWAELRPLQRRQDGSFAARAGDFPDRPDRPDRGGRGPGGRGPDVLRDDRPARLGPTALACLLLCMRQRLLPWWRV